VLLDSVRMRQSLRLRLQSTTLGLSSILFGPGPLSNGHKDEPFNANDGKTSFLLHQLLWMLTGLSLEFGLGAFFPFQTRSWSSSIYGQSQSVSDRQGWLGDS
jgi:hypothetical protein